MFLTIFKKNRQYFIDILYKTNYLEKNGLFVNLDIGTSALELELEFGLQLELILQTPVFLLP